MQIVELEMVPLSLRPVLQRLYDMKTTQSALREGVLFSTKRNNYYYDTGTGKVIVLDDDTSYIFRVLFDPTLSAETFLISLTKVDPNAVKNLLQTIDAERLFQRPPLLSMGKEIAAGVTDTEQKVEQIILEVTEQCNFRCKYCVYSEDFSGNRDFGNRRMPTEIAFKAIDWALENSGAKLAITFYGGEPLLNFKLMKAVIERSQAKRGNKEIVYSFTSNMSLMTREIATYLAQVPNLYIMASIDGPRTVHDAYRVYANDAPTFEDSIGGLRILADAYAGSHMPVNINAVLTPPFGFEKLEQVNAYFESLDWLPATCHVNITYPSYGTCPGLDEYYDKITGNPKYALHGMCNPLMITQPSTAVNNDLEVAANVIQLRNAVSDILQEAYEDTLAEIESERANLTYSDVVDSVGGHVSYNAFQLISMYCAYQGEDDYTKISLTDLSEQVQAHQTEYYAYTTSEEVRTEPVQKEVRGQTITVQEDHTYTVFALSYVGDDYFADTVWQLDDKQKSYADAYAHNLTVYLHEIEEREGISILGQINDALIDDDSPAPGGGFGNPFNDPNWEQHITSFFGKRKDVGIPGKDTTNHNGLDIAYPYGTPILAVEAGTVIKAGYHVSYGNYLVINHGGGYCTLYAHCSQLLAQVGDTVNKYDTIAKVGATGDVTGNHLHICVIVDGVYVNPKGYLH